MLDLAEARRRRNRWRYLSAAAAVVVIAAGLFGGLQLPLGGTTHRWLVGAGAGTWETVQGSSSVTGASASVAYSKELWGNAFQVLVDHIPMGTTCELWVVHPDGTRTEVAAWTTAQDEGQGLVRGLDAEHAAADQQLPDHGGRPGAGYRHADLTPGHAPAFPGGNG